METAEPIADGGVFNFARVHRQNVFNDETVEAAIGKVTRMNDILTDVDEFFNENPERLLDFVVRRHSQIKRFEARRNQVADRETFRALPLETLRKIHVFLSERHLLNQLVRKVTTVAVVALAISELVKLASQTGVF